MSLNWKHKFSRCKNTLFSRFHKIFWYKYSENSLRIPIFAFKFNCSSVFKKEIEDYEYTITFSQAYHASSRGS